MEMPRYRIWDAESRGDLRELWSVSFGESDLAVPSPDLSSLAHFDAYPKPRLLLLNATDEKQLAEWMTPHQMTPDRDHIFRWGALQHPDAPVTGISATMASLC